ncbi:unnamed protein product [Prorocentrum cordatum]|uniref:Uncharacterized protein n=1 Tax=Prorocentrum cordatum TaxID=2364126 RepID=A0ABN9PAB7_9DINO|nr:unnamed protein product [Polarella glacialis]
MWRVRSHHMGPRDGRFGPHKNEVVNLTRWPKLYAGKFYKTRRGQNSQSEHISNVLGQMRHQKDCAEMIQSRENSTGARYAAVLKVRDNTLALRPVVPELLVSIDKVVVKRCASWGGVNDKVMALPRKHLEGILGSTYDFMQKVMNDPVLDSRMRSLSQTSANTEMIVLWTLRASGAPVLHEDTTKRTDVGLYLPFTDGRCQSGSESGREDRWCVVAHCKDCHPPEPWTLNVTCSTAGGRVEEGTDAWCKAAR